MKRVFVFSIISLSNLYAYGTTTHGKKDEQYAKFTIETNLLSKKTKKGIWVIIVGDRNVIDSERFKTYEGAKDPVQEAQRLYCFLKSVKQGDKVLIRIVKDGVGGISKSRVGWDIMYNIARLLKSDGFLPSKDEKNKDILCRLKPNDSWAYIGERVGVGYRKIKEKLARFNKGPAVVEAKIYFK